jgi:hypothetical protein
MHKRFTAEEAEKGVAVGFGIVDEPVHGREIDGVSIRIDIDPAALTAEVAGVDNGNVKKWRKIFAAAEAALEFLDREHSFEPEIPGELPQAALVGCSQGSIDEAREHVRNLDSGAG